MKLAITILLVLVLIGIGFTYFLPSPNTLALGESWYGVDWDYRIKLTVNSSLIDDNLTHFPVLVVLNSSNMDFSPTQTLGEDIRFTQDDGETLLDYEFESWNKTAEEAWIWVSDSAWTIDSGTDTDFYMYYGNDGASSGENITGVWDANYKMVLHMTGADAAALDDSTDNNNDVFATDIGKPSYNQIGNMYNCVEFDGVADGMYVLDDADFTVISFTLEVWVEPDDLDRNERICEKYGSVSLDNYALYKFTTGDGVFRFVTHVSGTGFSCESDGVPTGSWEYIVGIRDTAAMTLYVDSVAQADTETNAGEIDSENDFTIGVGWTMDANWFDGKIDEMRFSNSARSVPWLVASLHSGNDNLLIYGAEELYECTPEVDTLAAISVEEITATLEGDLTDYCLNTVTERGFVWGTSSQGLPGNTTAPGATSYDLNWTETNGNFAEETFSHDITSLTEGELYYNRACANSTTGFWGYGNEITFLTKPVEPNTLVVVDGTGESIDLTWNRGAGADYTEIWGQNGSYPAARSIGELTYNSTGTSHNDATPSAGEIWYYRAWSFTTEGGKSQYSDTYDEANALCIKSASITTDAADDIEETTVTLNANITDTGGENNDERGFDWDTDSGAPYVSDWTEGGSFNTGVFDHEITSLTKGELYYFRGKTHNTEGWSYGSEEIFLTKPDEPNTFVAVDGTGESIDLTWNKGTGAGYTEIWGKDGSYPSGRGNGTLTYNNTGSNHNDSTPNAGETWYYRAWSFVTEGGESQYSDTYDEDNALCVDTPSVTTNAADDIEETTATLNANLTNIGGENNSDQGFEWDTDSGAPYTYNQTSGGSFGTGVFDEAITGLTKGELYYFRGMSQNAEGWGYGSELTFLTKPDEPTNLVCSINTTVASIYLTWVNGDGRDTTLIRYALGDYPADESSGILAYNSTGTIHDVTSLNVSTSYYFRAWSWCTEGGLEQFSDATADCTDTTLPGNPSNLSAITTNCSIALEWTEGEGGDKTHLRGQQDSYPTDVSSGSQIYFSTSNSTTHDVSHNERWYYRAWTYNSTSTKYSANYSQVIADISSCLSLLPNAPTNFTITQIGTGSINLSWIIGFRANTTIVRVSEGSCPVDYTDGYSVYDEEDNWTTYDDLNFTSITYCFRAWSYNPAGYSLDYAEGKIGGDSMVLIGLVILPLGLMTLALWKKQIWIMLGAGISFICLAAYGLIDGSPGEAIWITGIFSIVFSLIIFLYAFFGMREPVEMIPFEEPDDAYDRELRESKEARKKNRKTSLRRR